jgi:signal transduction histidine kinase
VLAQELTGIKMELAWLRHQLAKPVATTNQKILEEKVSALIDLTDRASQSVQRIATELRPVVLDKLGLCSATQWVAADFQKRTNIRCEASVPNLDLALDRDHSTALFRILQESLTNVARHAQATKVEIKLCREADELILTVRDNGRGIQPAELKDPRSLGLLGMHERASLLGGSCTITGQAGVGTSVEVRLPTASIADPNAKL